MSPVPFKSRENMYLQMAIRQASVMSDSLPGSLPHIRAGRLRGLAVSAGNRSPYVPDLPTVSGQGLPGSAGFEAQRWVDIATPLKTLSAILETLNTELVRIVNLADGRGRLYAMAFTVAGNRRAGFSAYVKSDFARWAKAVRDSRAKVN